ncbi:uncharacterized protein LOC122506846 [Leptopilina heterotoma]|uniref:uncharacterized protein LOC122506846 n=1 Tax=Leptopilina heterotoma TaxID=63436 RepID=UPI001CA8443D|nr:uncharacterized protein LOC122506846 [Leptopilina heterotoma]
MSRQQRISGCFYSNTMFGVICTIACLASATSAQLKYNQSGRDSWDNVENYLTRGDFSDIDLENLMQVLDLVLNSKEFQPLTISVATFDINSYLTGQISKFFERKLITCYQIDFKNNLSSFKFTNLHYTTWIIIVDNLQMLDFNCNTLNLLWNSRNKFVIISLSNDKSALNFEKLFSNFWKRYGISKILISTKREKFKYVYRYLPFERNLKKFGLVQKVFVDGENIEVFRKNQMRRFNSVEVNKKKICDLKELGNIFENFENLNNYPIKVTIFKSQMVQISKIGNRTNLSGLDVNAMFLLRSVLNADFRINVLKHDYKSDPFETALINIENNKADIVMTTYFVKPYDDFKSFEFTVGVHMDKVCLFGKAAGKVPKSFMPFLPIALDFWPLFIIYNILISAFWIKFKSYSEKIHEESLKKNILGINILRKKHLEEKKNLSQYPPEIDSRLEFCGEVAVLSCSPLEGDSELTAQRIFLAGTLIFTLIIFGLYESTLLSAMSKPFEYQELETLNDVLDTDYSILTKYENLRENTFYNVELKNRVILLQGVEESLRKIVVNNKSVLGIMRLSTAELEDRSKYYDENGEYLLHVIEECPCAYCLSYVVKEYSPYLERINKILSKISEGGLFLKWYNDMRYAIYKEEQKKIASRPLVSDLTLEHYSLIFLILLGAFLCSTFVFIAEIQFASSARHIGE